MVNIVNRLQERLAKEMRCREEAEARLANVEARGPMAKIHHSESHDRQDHQWYPRRVTVKS